MHGDASNQIVCFTNSVEFDQGGVGGRSAAPGLDHIADVSNMIETGKDGMRAVTTLTILLTAAKWLAW